ncbi:MAG: hypothetical protein P4M09_30800 [Devosia sp.]|nr:hypothetical protein [Devosia sp.]
MASLFGMVLGALVKLAGGFSALTSAPASSSGGGLLGPIAALLVVVIGVGGSLFVDSSRIGLRRPIGAICFLTSFLVSGLYWQYLPVG